MGAGVRVRASNQVYNVTVIKTIRGNDTDCSCVRVGARVRLGACKTGFGDDDAKTRDKRPQLAAAALRGGEVRAVH